MYVYLAAPPKSGRTLCTVQPHGATCEAISYHLFCGEGAQDVIRERWGDKIPSDYMAMGMLERYVSSHPRGLKSPKHLFVITCCRVC